jgi:molecular chaperone DnaJ
MKTMQNPYEVLGVSENCDEEALKKAYRAKCFEYHPDRQVGKTQEQKDEAEKKFKEVQTAYNSIIDGSYAASQKQQDFGFGNIADMFANFMGMRGFRQQPQHQEKPKQVEVEINDPITLTFMEAVQGCKKNIDLEFNLSCFDCMGRRFVPTNNKCKSCNGSGFQTNRTSNGFFQQMIQTMCESCSGLGTDLEQCKSCNGSGATSQNLKEEIEILPNTPNGRKLTKNIQGVEVVYIIRTAIDIPKDFYLSTNRQELIKDIEIDVFDFILGGKIQLSLEDGEQNLIIEHNSSQQQVTVENKGLPKNGKRGLLKVNLIPQFPKSITEQQRELLNKIKDAT